jgi:peptide deformylase
MAVREILRWPHPKLSELSSYVEKIDDDIRDLVDDLTDTMQSRSGAGIAAPQIGVPQGVFLIAPWVAEAERTDPLVFINPEVIWTSEELVKEKEGCLSFPDIWVFVERPERCRVRATNLWGAEFTVEGGGLFARALQHEYDHLNGKLMTDFVGRLKRDMIRKKLKKKRK